MKWPAILVASLALLMIGVEAGARFAVPRISKIERRTQVELRALFAPPDSGKPVAVLMGNSLLDAAVQVPSLKNELRETVEVRRFMVEQTFYYDWYYGLKKLFADGMRADTVVLMLSPGQLIAEDWRGDYSAKLLMRPQDVFQLAVETKRHPTETTSLMFSSISEFYGLRSEIRKVLLGRIMPDMTQLTWRLVTVPSRLPRNSEIERISRVRLEALNELCRKNNTRFVFLLAPTFSRVDGTPTVLRAGKLANVTTIAASRPELFTASEFPDGYHAASSAAMKYTPAAARALTTVLQHPLQHPK